MGLDVLYGPGSLDTFEAICQRVGDPFGWTQTTTELDSEIGDVGTHTVWTDAGGVAQAYWDVEFKQGGRWTRSVGMAIADPANQGKGMVYAISAGVVDWWVDRGALCHTIIPESAMAERAFRLVGHTDINIPGVRDHFGTETPGTRIKEYVAWREAGRPADSEPGWHRELREEEEAGA